MALCEIAASSEKEPRAIIVDNKRNNTASGLRKRDHATQTFAVSECMYPEFAELIVRKCPQQNDTSHRKLPHNCRKAVAASASYFKKKTAVKLLK